MNNPGIRTFDEHWIRNQRGEKNLVDLYRPYHSMVELERTRDGKMEEVATIFLTNRECRYTCLMCDLWKNTTDNTVPEGAIPDQIEWALQQLPPARHIKLYNSASFFDPRAIPVKDYSRIADLVRSFDTVIVENHPNLTGELVYKFAGLLRPHLQVAMGLETSDRAVLKSLNKKMKPEDYRRSVGKLRDNGISTRTFILLKPPFTGEEEGIGWAKASLEYAFDSGSECCTVIPVRAGNGAMEQLEQAGVFSPPKLISLEEVHAFGIGLGRGDVFADTWDLHLFSSCGICFNKRKERMERMNLEQRVLPLIDCDCNVKQDDWKVIS
jgi:radical SAM enzyme (TIGR01210 family)